MAATEVARLIEQAEAHITVMSEDMISDCLYKLESAERSNLISEEKRDALQEKYDELVDHLKDKERRTFEELRTGPMRSDGGGDETVRLASTHIKRGKQKYYDRVFMAGLMRLSSKFNDTAAGTREKLYDFLSLALNKDREWVEKVFPLPKKTQMDAYKRASGRALRMVETRKLADYLPYSMEIDGASILRANREMIHINLPVSNKMPAAERIVGNMRTYA